MDASPSVLQEFTTSKGFLDLIPPEVLFLCETKNSTLTVERVLRKEGYKSVFTVDPMGLSRGLAVAWKDEVRVHIVKHDRFFVYFSIEDPQAGLKWEIVGVHLHTDETNRGFQFAKLLQILEGGSETLAIIGDFNAIKNQEEKEGERQKSSTSIQQFRDFINERRLVDIGYEGDKYTWSNRQFGENRIKDRLDRALVTNEWKGEFPATTLAHLSDSGSDHKVILLNTGGEERRVKKRFRFQER
ncbi:uncharacterized protein [Arachis hypogaea]|uniref:uncharacterized protein n=1 Tax=Arachis hypogaea TaxID=3818 RepID=UPI003B223E70